jgi:rhodanese-related sulfurtransferase
MWSWRFRWPLDAFLLVVLAAVTAAHVAPAGATHTPQLSVPARLTVDQRLILDAADWDAGSHNVVLAVQSTCPACRASLNFYSTLGRITSGSDTQIIVIAPDGSDVIQRWLAEGGVRVDQVIPGIKLGDLGISVTPTLILVDPTGRVTDIASGRLDKADEADVLARLDGTSSAPLMNRMEPERLRAPDLVRLMADQPVTVIDVRDRADYRRDHRPGALNIPKDELELRAAIELPLDEAIVVDCSRNQSYADCELAGRILRRLGTESYILLPSDTADRPRPIAGGLAPGRH